MRIVFIGCVESSYAFLEALTDNSADICGVITKRKSKFNSDFKELTPICEKYGIPYIFVDNINDSESKQFIKDLEPDIGYCFGWSQLISKELMEYFPQGIIGYHPAELPRNRGRHPIIWALALGLEQTASTFFRMDCTADTGDILSQELVCIHYDDDARSLMDRLLEVGGLQVVKLTKELETNSVVAKSQNTLQGNTWRKRGIVDGRIDWRMSCESIYNLVRALTRPYVGAHFEKDGAEIKVWKVKAIHTNDFYNIEPGKIISVLGNTFQVKAGDGIVEVLECDLVDVEAGTYLY